jgi:hypothetical protein
MRVGGVAGEGKGRGGWVDVEGGGEPDVTGFELWKEIFSVSV